MNYYEILQITPNASEEVIKAAYKALVKKYHPDNGAIDGIEKMQLINDAYRTLSDPFRRKEYDKTLLCMRNYSVSAKTSDKREEDVFDSSSPMHYSDNYKESKEVDEESEGIFGGAFRTFVRGVSKELQRNRQIKDNAYYDGLNMDDYELVHAYKNNYGLKRSGYAQALEERGFLYRTDDGKLIPTEEFKHYWR